MTQSIQIRPNGFNHLAYSTTDLSRTMLFFNEVLGLKLATLYWMHGAKGAVHAFMYTNAKSLLAFVYNPKNPDKIIQGQTHPGVFEQSSYPGTMHHLSFSVASIEDLNALKQRLTEKNITYTEHQTESFLHSVLFNGPEGMLLEVSAHDASCQAAVVNREAAAFAGLSEETIAKLQNPSDYQVTGDSVVNPSANNVASDYKMAYPSLIYKTITSAPDEVILQATREKDSPAEAKRFNLENIVGMLRLYGHLIVTTVKSLLRLH